MATTDVPPALRVSVGEDDVLLRDVPQFANAIIPIASGGSALDAEVVQSNLDIAHSLLIGQAAVKKFVTASFRKLAIAPASTKHRRVQAVLMFLREQYSGP